MEKTLKKVGKVVLIVVLVVAILLAALLIFLTATEYNPQETEKLSVPQGTQTAAVGDELSFLTFNTGYAGLDQDEDFFMDGGSGVNPKSRGQVESNLAGIADTLKEYPADVYFLQETDVNSGRTFHIDEAAYYENALGLPGTFAYNYKCNFVPYPLPMIGQVQSGLLTMSGLAARSAQRVSLPVPFDWPIRTCNLKRCLLVEHIPLEGTDAQLVLVNLHLEAYDDGEGKAAQTRVLADVLRSEYEKGNYVVAGGDFNQTFPGVREYPAVDEENWKPGVIGEDVLPDGFRFAFDDSLPTCRLLCAPYTGSYETSQMFVIDGFIVSPNIQVEEVQTIRTDFAYSDHQPVRMRLTLTPAV
ncbi:endonuclease/exonuclease/phosphatase family protein [Christensenella timonensis]|uniref:endonuclease/exonuclease/phosphatase family protein n=1 Tax=Christensenella timonensis TaxID=1816678 RepID=UPI00082F6F78|nr:endonuclease/exonuclease/phosphatase family protein [Christensenella timonensis]